MKYYRSVLAIGVIEILIGSITLLTNTITLAFRINSKSLSVLIFVYAASLLSLLIGIGILRFKKWAYSLLLYFASLVAFEKILILLNVFQLNGALNAFVPSYVVSLTSLAYHGAVIYYLTHSKIKRIFFKKHF